MPVWKTSGRPATGSVDPSYSAAMNMERFSGRKALVTGGASGIGRCTALRLAEEGADVVAVDVNAEQLNLLAAVIPAPPAGSALSTADVRFNGASIAGADALVIFRDGENNP